MADKIIYTFIQVTSVPYRSHERHLQVSGLTVYHLELLFDRLVSFFVGLSNTENVNQDHLIDEEVSGRPAIRNGRQCVIGVVKCYRPQFGSSRAAADARIRRVWSSGTGHLDL